MVRSVTTKIPSFGITRVPSWHSEAGNDQFIVGYMTDDFIKNSFIDQLVSGVIWLVRNGKNNVQNALQFENGGIQGFFIQSEYVSEIIFNLDTFNLEDFIKVQSARTAIGHDADGRLILVEIDGKTHER